LSMTSRQVDWANGCPKLQVVDIPGLAVYFDNRQNAATGERSPTSSLGRSIIAKAKV
jgi:hypothetical protein